MGQFLPELFLTLSASLLLRWGAIVSTDGRRGYPTLRHGRRWLSARVAAGTGLLALNGDGGVHGLWAGRLVNDPLARGAKVLLAGATAACLVGRRSTLRRDRRDALEYPVLRLFALLGRRLLASATDLLVFYLALELQSLSLYILAAFRRGSAYSTEAGLKYFVLGAFASGLFLFGCSLVYGTAGTTAYEELGRHRRRGGNHRGVVAGFALILAAVFFKLSAAPYHRWAPDVREGAPTPSARFFAAVTKIAALVALARLCYGPFQGVRRERGPRRRTVAGASRAVGALGALRQRRWKRFLAYSTIGHRGYILRGLASGTTEGLQGFLVYRAVYTVRSVNVWTTRRSLRRVAPRETEVDGGTTARTRSRNVVWRSELAGLGVANPAVARTLAAARLSRAGVPPRAGFRAKFRVLFAARDASLYGLAVLAVGAAVVGAYYYLRWRKIRYFETPATTVTWLPIGTESALVRGRTLLPTVLLRASPTALLLRTHERAVSLVAG